MCLDLENEKFNSQAFMVIIKIVSFFFFPEYYQQGLSSHMSFYIAKLQAFWTVTLIKKKKKERKEKFYREITT